MFWWLHNMTLNDHVSESAVTMWKSPMIFRTHYGGDFSLLFSDTFSQRNMCNLQMRSCLWLVLIAVVSEEILYAGQEYRTRGVRSDWLPFIFSVSVIRVKFQTPVNNQVISKGVNRSPKTFIKAVDISVCSEIIIWTKSYCCWLHPWGSRGRENLKSATSVTSDTCLRCFKQHQFFMEIFLERFDWAKTKQKWKQLHSPSNNG